MATTGYDTTKSGKHAIDYLRTFDTTISPQDPAVDAGITVATTDTFPIPLDSNVSGDPNFVGTQQPGVFRMYNGDLTSTSAYTLSGSYAGDSTTTITITWTALDDGVGDPTTNSLLMWGGHIASRADWGQNNAAVNISGNPFHMRLVSSRDVTNDDAMGGATRIVRSPQLP